MLFALVRLLLLLNLFVSKIFTNSSDEIFIEYENGYSSDSEITEELNNLGSCDHLICNDGEFCALNDKREAKCMCIQECMDVHDERQKICSTNNITYGSDCELLKKQCNCRHSPIECDGDYNVLSDRVHYYGECKARVHDWIEYSVTEWMKTVLSDAFYQNSIFSNEAANAALTQFCTLDKDANQILTTDEIDRFAATIWWNEPCTMIFLRFCDIDSDTNIDKGEWMRCTGFQDIDDLKLQDHICIS